MRSRKQKKKELSEEQLEVIDTKNFFDRIAPGIIRFYTDHYICGNFYKSCWALTEYPPSTEETAIPRTPCRQKRRNAKNLQPPCDEYETEKKSFSRQCVRTI